MNIAPLRLKSRKYFHYLKGVVNARLKSLRLAFKVQFLINHITHLHVIKIGKGLLSAGPTECNN